MLNQLKYGCVELSVGKRAVEKAASRKSPTAGLFHSAWKSRKSAGFRTFSTAPTTTDLPVQFSGNKNS
jgi:hypothetical protein